METNIVHGHGNRRLKYQYHDWSNISSRDLGSEKILFSIGLKQLDVGYS
jgi:hypothetical protein